jgi:hypothetical protein
LYPIPASSIRDIDHPGNVLLTTGAVLLGLGAWMVADGYGWVGEGRGDDDLKTVGSVYGGLGLGMALGGFVPYLLSRTAAGDVARDHNPSTPTPVSLPAQHRSDDGPTTCCSETVAAAVGGAGLLVASDSSAAGGRISDGSAMGVRMPPAGSDGALRDGAHQLHLAYGRSTHGAEQWSRDSFTVGGGVKDGPSGFGQFSYRYAITDGLQYQFPLVLGYRFDGPAGVDVTVATAASRASYGNRAPRSRSSISY